ncbi:unnamed protein product [Effrenium voratum]|nr:unnamed protein product [Effrenium voratum]
MATCLVRVAQKALRSSLQLPLVPAASRLRSFASNPKKWQGPTAAKAQSSAWHIASQRELCNAPVARTEQETCKPPNKTSFCLCGRAKPCFGWPHDANPSCCGRCKVMPGQPAAESAKLKAWWISKIPSVSVAELGLPSALLTILGQRVAVSVRLRAW